MEEWHEAGRHENRSHPHTEEAPDHVRGGAGVLLYAGKVISPAARGRQQMVPWCTASITISIFRDVSAKKYASPHCLQTYAGTSRMTITSF